MAIDQIDWGSGQTILDDQVYSGPLSQPSPVLISGLGQYTSLTLIAGVGFVAGGQITVLNAQPQLSLSSALGSFLMSSPARGGVALGDGVVWQMPLDGDSISITTFLQARQIDLTVLASNRPCDALRIMGNNAPRVFEYTGAYTNGIDAFLLATDGGDKYSGCNGPCTIILAANAVAGNLGYEWVDVAGAIHAVFFPPVALGSKTVYAFEHPPVCLNWKFRPTATVGAALTRIDIAGHM